MGAVVGSEFPHTPPDGGPWGVARARGTAARTTGPSVETRARIVEATLETIKTEGMLGASARAIARTGGFNQASIYYHFGSINEAVIAAIEHMSHEQLARYEVLLGGVTSLPELVRVAADLHREDVESGTIHVLSQVTAAASADEVFAAQLGEVIRPWVATVERALRRVLGDSPLGAALPLEELANAVSALFLGIELLGRLVPDGAESERLFAAIEGIARLVDLFLQSPLAGLVQQTADGR